MYCDGGQCLWLKVSIGDLMVCNVNSCGHDTTKVNIDANATVWTSVSANAKVALYVLEFLLMSMLVLALMLLLASF